MKFSILTPHHQQPDFLKRCVKSVRDQLDVSPSPPFAVQHWVQDSQATGRSPTQLREQLGVPETQVAGYELKISCENDQGMYDALNRAYEKSDGDIIGHINCDEQYLPGTLNHVHEWFLKDPGLQVLSGAVVITYPDGSYCCSRKPVKPGCLHTAVCHLSLFTAATFYRRSFLESLGVFFDTRFRAAGDADLFARILQSGAKVEISGRYFSLFAETGSNLALSQVAKAERKIRLKEVHPFIVKLKPAIAMHHQLKKLVHGCYFPKPFAYDFINDTLKHERIQVASPTGIWRDRRRLRLHKSEWFAPHNERTSFPPGRLDMRKSGLPHVLVVSAPRSGTHLMIDAILNNLPAYKRKPLFVELDHILDDAHAMDTLLETSGYVIKTHYPVMETGSGNPRASSQLEQLARNSVIIHIHRDQEQTFRSAQRMFPWLEKTAFLQKIGEQNHYWEHFCPIKGSFKDLIDTVRLKELLQSIATATGTRCNTSIVPPPPKQRRWLIYLLKFLTRTLGAASPRINTGIRLGESQ